MLGYSIAARAVYFGATVMLALSAFSTADNALWQAFLTLQSVQLVADLGLTATLSRQVSYAYAGASELAAGVRPFAPVANVGKPNWQLLLGMRAAARRLYCYITLVWSAVILLGGTAAISPLLRAADEPAQALVAWLCIVVGSAARVFTNADIAYLSGTGLIAAVRRWEGDLWLVSAGIAAGVIWCGGDIAALAATGSLILLTNALINGMLSRRRTKSSEAPTSSGRDLRLLSSIWPSVWRSAVGIVSYYVSMRIAAIAVAGRVEPAAGAQLLFCVNALTLLVNFSSAPFYSRLPAMAQAWARQDVGTLKSIGVRGIRLASWAFSAIVMVFGPALHVAFPALGSSLLPPTPGFWFLVSAAFLVERHGIFHLQLHSQTNEIKWHIAQGATGVALLVVLFLLLPFMGVSALPWAQLIACALVQSPMTARWSYRSLGLRFPEFELRTMAAPAVLMLLWSLCWILIAGN